MAADGASENRGVSVYERIGADGFTALTAAFYRRVAEDALLRPMYESSVGAEGFPGLPLRRAG